MGYWKKRKPAEKDGKVLSAIKLIRHYRRGCPMEEIYRRGERAYEGLLGIQESPELERSIAESGLVPGHDLRETAQEIISLLLFNELNDPFLSMGLAPQAAKTEIKSRWKRLIRLYHPDRWGSPDSGQTAQKINESYRKALDQKDKIIYLDDTVKKRRRRIPINSGRLKDLLHGFPLKREWLFKSAVFLAAAGLLFTLALLALGQNAGKISASPDTPLPARNAASAPVAAAAQGPSVPDQAAGKSGNLTAEKTEDTARTRPSPRPHVRKKRKVFNVVPVQKAVTMVRTPQKKNTTHPEKNNGGLKNSFASDANAPTEAHSQKPAQGDKPPANAEEQISRPDSMARLYIPPTRRRQGGLLGEIHDFIDAFVETSAGGGVEKYLALFARGATENGRAVSSLVNDYQKRFSLYESRWSLQNLRIRIRDSSRADIEADYILQRFAINQDGNSTSYGRVRLSIIRVNDDFKILELNY